MDQPRRSTRSRHPPQRYGEWETNINAEIRAVEAEIANITDQLLELTSTRNRTPDSAPDPTVLRQDHPPVSRPSRRSVQCPSPTPVRSAGMEPCQYSTPVDREYYPYPTSTGRDCRPYSMPEVMEPLPHSTVVGMEQDPFSTPVSRQHPRSGLYATPLSEECLPYPPSAPPHGLLNPSRQAKLLYLSTISPVRFSGESRDFPQFQQRMRNLDDGILEDHELLEFLPKFLEGPALTVLRNLRGLTFGQVMDRFEERFGHPAKVANSYVGELTGGKSIPNEDRKGLLDLADKLTAAASSLSDQHFWEASCAPNLRKIANRLPMYLRNAWEKKVAKICESGKLAPDLHDMAKFVTAQAKAKNNPYYQSTASETTERERSGTKNPSRDIRRPVLAAATGIQVTQQCPFCDRSGHGIRSCHKLLNIPLNQRYGEVKRKGLCYICLGQNCSAARCTKSDCSDVCRNCRRPHHRMLPCNLRTYGPSESRTGGAQGNRDPSANREQNPLAYGPSESRTGGAQGNPETSSRRGHGAALPDEPTQHESSPSSGHDNRNTTSRRQTETSAQPTNANATTTPHIASSATTITSPVQVPMAAPLDSYVTRVLQPFVLPTLPVRIHGPNGHRTTYALLDSGSKATFLDEKLAVSLGINGPAVTATMNTVRDSHQQQMMQVEFLVSSLSSDVQVDIDDAYVMRGVDLPAQLGKELPTIDLSRYGHLAPLPFPDVETPSVGVLLGMPVTEAHEVVTYFRGSSTEPFAIQTKLGVAIAGHFPGDVSVANADVEPSQTDLRRAMERFCEIQDHGTDYPDTMKLSKAEQRAVGVLKDTLVQRCDGHYECGLLWAEPECELPYNRPTAVRRLGLLVRKFERDPEYRDMYHHAMNEIISSGWASPVNPDRLTIGPRTSYMSHFGVTNENKPGKVRPVFDVSEKTRGVSLNDMLLTGPDVTSRLAGVLARCRMACVGVAADIKAMFCQCYVREEDRDSQRFLWLDDDGITPREYRMNVHVFGASDSPFVANSCLRQVAEDYGGLYEPHVPKIVRENFYVDDTVFSCPTTESAVSTARQLKSLLSRGGFELVKFVSNDREVLKGLDQRDLLRPEIDLQLDDMPGERTLGLKWDLETDAFGFNIRNYDKPDTMRGMTSIVARVFDPLGFAAPVVFNGRKLISECWQRGVKWDDALPPDLLVKWRKFRTNLPDLENIRIPRPYFPILATCLDSRLKLQLHVFSDGSSVGTGNVVYLRATDPEGHVHVGFVMGKAKLLPKTPKLTVPRAELKGAVDGVRIAEKLKTELSDIDFTSDNVFHWTDSEIVLKYLSNETKRFHVFVANRQSEIRSYTNINQWNFCPGELNPADYPSRGVDPSLFTSQHPYLIGPAFLHEPEGQWPRRTVDPVLDGTDPEVKVLSTSIGAISSECESPIIALLERCSRYDRVKRVLVRIHRLADAMRGRRKVDSSTPMSLTELERAEAELVKSVQGHFYTDEMTKLRAERPVTQSSILGLNPFLDEAGILRSASRLTNAQMEYVTKFPAILPSPKVCRLSSLILRHYHETTAHGGHDLVLSTTREKYHIVHAKSFVRSITKTCVTCRKRNATPVEQLMADLPEDRFRFYEPVFCSTGTDCFGPVLAKQGRRTLKFFGVIFRCLTTGARHVEMVKNLDTDNLILALMRFVALRGGVRRIRSDNGGNYRGAEKELRELIESWNHDRITDNLAVRGIEWVFQPPYASSQSGVWERSVKEVKRHLYAVLGRTVPDVEVLRTFLYEVSAVLNQVPLCAASDDPSDYEALTPAHFLHGRNATLLTPVPTAEDGIYRKKWRQVQQLGDAYWRRLVREYVPTLAGRDKWRVRRRDLEVNDLVTVLDPDLPRSRWKLGRVVSVFPDKKGHVRSAEIRTENGKYVRPIQRLGLLLEADQLRGQ